MVVVSPPRRPGASSDQPPPRRRAPRRRHRLRWVLVAIATVLVLCGAAAIAAAVWWPSASLVPDAQALVGFRDSAPFGERLASVVVRDRHGRVVPAHVRDGRIWPDRKVAQGTRLTVEATVRRTGPLGWVVGRTEVVRETIRTPRARVSGRWLGIERGAPVTVSFTHPVRVVALDAPKGRLLKLPKPQKSVSTGVRVRGVHQTGIVAVRAAPRSWERLSPAASVRWFPEGPRPLAVVAPAPGSALQPLARIKLTFSVPARKLLGSRFPKLVPATPGRWLRIDSHTLAFVPKGTGYSLGTRVRVVLPSRVGVVEGKRTTVSQKLDWRVPPGSTLRLHELLATLGYLPLTWTPTEKDVPHTAAAEAHAAVQAPDGEFSWRYGNVPAQLSSLWSPDQTTVVTQGAVMAFQNANGLAVDGIAGPTVWRALLRDALAGKRSTSGYSFVLVHRDVPQSLSLWHDGAITVQTAVNTGVPSAPTELGTFPVYQRFETQTMRGTNPDGTHYEDPGIRWVSYFHDGEAIHGFNRGSYGTPQSVGCVELPVDAAGRVWPYTPIGTLVTVTH